MLQARAACLKPGGPRFLPHTVHYYLQAAASRFAPTGHALRNMERVAAAVSLNEPVLLVGETGTGKTTLVQQIAKQARGAGGREQGWGGVLAGGLL